MTTAVFGTAHLYGLTPPAASDAVLSAAWRLGFRAFDTAPLYGFGRSEAALGARVAEWPERPRVTSKVGLEAADLPSAGVRVAKAVARRLPSGLARRLRPGAGAEPRGVFDDALVRRSLERSLHRLGRIDRLLVHEARTDDVTDELLDVLSTFQQRGDVGALGVATANSHAEAVARRAPELFTVAHVEVGPFASRVDLPATVTTVVGHGALGPGGDALRRLLPSLAGEDEAGTRWREVTAGTRWAGAGGLADALVARAASGVDDLILASSRVDRLANLRDLVAGATRLEGEVDEALTALILAEAARSPERG